MADYLRYAETCNITQRDMVSAIKEAFPYFSKIGMSLACNPLRNALQLIPAAEDILVTKFGPGPGLSISSTLEKKNRKHDNKNKPNRMCVRLDDALRSKVEEVYTKMCFVSYQDLIEAAIAEFVEKYNYRR